MSYKPAKLFLENGSSSYLNRFYPNLITTPIEGYDLAIGFDTQNLPYDAATFLENISQLRKNVLGGPLDKYLTALKNKNDLGHTIALPYRQHSPNDILYICPTGGKIVVIFSVDFSDVTDKALAKVFLQEFVEAQRVVRNAPPVSYNKDPPGELLSSGVKLPSGDIAGFISFAIEERHLSTDAAKDKVVAHLTGFRNYLQYHIKCSKTYLHTRMRNKVNNWMQVLKRAQPEVQGEKKTASGKTFIKK